MNIRICLVAMAAFIIAATSGAANCAGFATPSAPTAKSSPAITPDTTAPASPSLTTSENSSAPAANEGSIKPAALIVPGTAATPAVSEPAATASPSVSKDSAAKTADPPDDGITPGRRLYLKTRDASVIDPLNWAVMVSKSKHELAVYYCGRLYARYDAVFGRNLDGSAKEYENDRRTPEGVYTIIQKNPSRRFRWFLKLNYPNLFDRQHFEMLRDSEVIPVRGDGQAPSMGGAIGIHGTDVPVLNKGRVNWTTGCVSVGNDAIAEIARLLPIGTIVVIKR